MSVKNSFLIFDMKHAINILIFLTAARIILVFTASSILDLLIENQNVGIVVNTIFTAIFYYCIYKIVSKYLSKESQQYLTIALIIFANSIGYLTII